MGFIIELATAKGEPGNRCVEIIPLLAGLCDRMCVMGDNTFLATA